MTLFVNACIRNNSRTEKLALYLLEKFDDQIEEVKLSKANIDFLDEGMLKKRDEANRNNSFSSSSFDLAKQFARADRIVIAAPFWDLAFPAFLKVYLEQINVPGIVFQYSENGMPISLCRAKELYYVTTGGGKLFKEDYCFGYIESMAKTFFGIENSVFVKAENLDIEGADIEAIIEETKKSIDSLFINA